MGLEIMVEISSCYGADLKVRLNLSKKIWQIFFFFQFKFVNTQVVLVNRNCPKFGHMNQVDLQDYGLLNELGRGGFGVVYKAWNTKANEFLAAKFSSKYIDLQDPKESLYLHREMETMSKGIHPAILRYHGFSPKDFSAMIVLLSSWISLRMDRSRMSSSYDCSKWGLFET